MGITFIKLVTVLLALYVIRNQNLNLDYYLNYQRPPDVHWKIKETVTDLANYCKPEILALHGIGPGSIPKLVDELEKNGLPFKENNF